MRLHIKSGSLQINCCCQPSFRKWVDNRRAKSPYLTDGIFETDAYAVPSKSQNSAVLGQGVLSSTQCSNSSWA